MIYDPFTFRLPVQAYSPSVYVADMVATEQQIRREYSRLRSIYVKRVSRLQSKGLPTPPVSLPTITELRTHADFRVALQRSMALAANAVSDPETLMAGARQKKRRTAIDALHHSGYYFVTDENFGEFVHWMEAARQALGGKFYDSDMAAEAFEFIENAEIPPDILAEYFSVFLTDLEEAQAAYEEWKQDADDDPDGDKLAAMLEALL